MTVQTQHRHPQVFSHAQRRERIVCRFRIWQRRGTRYQDSRVESKVLQYQYRRRNCINQAGRPAPPNMGQLFSSGVSRNAARHGYRSRKICRQNNSTHGQEKQRPAHRISRRAIEDTQSRCTVILETKDQHAGRPDPCRIVDITVAIHQDVGLCGWRCSRKNTKTRAEATEGHVRTVQTQGRAPSDAGSPLIGCHVQGTGWQRQGSDQHCC